MKAGFYQTDITPAIGMERSGGYGKLYLAGIHDPLKARAAVFDDGRDRVALVGVDMCAIPSAAFVHNIRAEVEQCCGIKREAILIAASHTHSGGPVLGQAQGNFQKASPLLRKLARECSPAIDPVYVEWATRQIVTAILEADRRKEKAVLSVGVGREDQVAFNRRFRMKSGRVYTHPGKGNPDIVGPAGPTDPAVGVLAAWRPKGDLLGCLVNYACHGTTMCVSSVSADWIGYMEKTIRDVMGASVGVVFLNGACGDVTQVNNLDQRVREFGEFWACKVGTRIGAEAIKVLASAARGDLKPVRHGVRILRLRRRRLSKQALRESLAVVKRGLADSRQWELTPWVFAKERLLADYLATRQPRVPVEIQAIQIGPAIILANPAELFCQLGLDIKKDSGFPYTFVVELANDKIGYIPGRAAFAADGGGYETALTSYSNMAIETGEKIVQACLKLAQRFRPGRVPGRWPIAKASPPWDYGMLGPDGE